MNDSEMVLSISMFFAGAVGTIATMYLKQISETLKNQIILVSDIDKRVVRVETKVTDHLGEKIK